MMQEKQFRLLSALCPTLFEDAEGLIANRGPRGGCRSWETSRTHQKFSVDVVKAAERSGLIADGQITQAGMLRFMDAMRARQEAA